MCVPQAVPAVRRAFMTELGSFILLSSNLIWKLWPSPLICLGLDGSPSWVTFRRNQKMSLVHSLSLPHNEKVTRILKIQYSFWRENNDLQSIEASSVKKLQVQGSWTLAYGPSGCSSGIDFMMFQETGSVTFHLWFLQTICL